jgi:hypothetical protein
MKGYAIEEVFSADELALYEKARQLMELAPYKINDEEVRCHEVVRAVALKLDLSPLQVVDGWYGLCDHSWLWTKVWKPFTRPPTALDVYSVGRHPLVQLVDTSSGSLPFDYSRGDPRKDIKNDVVVALLESFAGWVPP